MHIFSIPKIKLMLVQFQTFISQIKLHQTLIVTVRHQTSSQPFLCTVNKSLFHCVSCVVLLLCLIKLFLRYYPVFQQNETNSIFGKKNRI